MVSSKQANAAAGNSKDASKKSLSFFPDDSGESSDGNTDGLEDNHRSSEAHQNQLNEPSNAQSKLEADHKVAVPMESDRDESSSSTSSCSCEDHSSVAGLSDEDPHGDLDYDDDSLTNSPSHQKKHTHLTENSEPSRSSDKEQKTVDSQVEALNTNGHVNAVQDAESVSMHSDTQDGPKRKNRIRSFINLDRSEPNDKNDNDKMVEKQIKDRSHKSYESLLKYFFKDACFFQIKSINHENVEISKSMGVWSTPIQNELRLNQAFREHRNVILIFSVQQSGAFQGFARMISESERATKPVPWVLPGRMSNAALGGVFHVQWLCTKELDFNVTRDLHNPFNNDKPVKVARDGQQVEPKVGRKLCSLFPRDSKKRILSGVEKLKTQTKQRKELAQTVNGYYPLNDMRAYHHNAMPNRDMLIGHNAPIFNGYAPSTSHNHSHPYLPPDYVDFRGPPGVRRRGLELGPSPGHFARRRPFPNQEPSTMHPRTSFNMPPMRSYGEPHPGYGQVFPDVTHEAYYADYYGPNYHQSGPPIPRMVGPEHPRPYYDHNMSQARHHPYQRTRR